jgi:hypothetical protein
MFKTPERMAWIHALVGMGFGVLDTLLIEHRLHVFAVCLGFLIGTAWATMILIRWQRNVSRGKRFGFAWFLVPNLAVPLVALLGLAPKVGYALAGYGLTLGVGIVLCERRLKRPISWEDLNPRQEE